jgi:uncharacterized membrane protein
MEIISNLVDFILHLDVHLNTIIQNFGIWTYLILFLIIFLETGIVVTPTALCGWLVRRIGFIEPDRFVPHTYRGCHPG